MSGRKKSKPWWQWLVMYPGLFIALAGAAPTAWRYYQSFVLGVAVNQVDAAMGQNELWVKNRACLTGQALGEVKTAHGSAVSVSLCPTGDVLVTVKTADAKEFARWVSPREFVVEKSAGVVGAAFAAPLQLAQQGPTRVICQARTRDNFTLIRVQDRAGQCWDKFYDPFTGALIKTLRAQCDPNCQVR